MQTVIAQYFKKMKDFNLKKYLAENKLTEESPQDNPKIVHVSDKISDLRFKDKITSFMQLEPHLQDPLFRKALLKFLDFDASDKEFPGIRVDDLLSALEDNVIDGNIQL